MSAARLAGGLSTTAGGSSSRRSSPRTATSSTPAGASSPAQLYVGPHGVVSSLTAAEMHGVTAADDPQVHLAVPVGRYARSAAFVTVRRTRQPDPATWSRHHVTLGSPARAVVDAARDAATLRQSRAIVIEAVQRRIVTVPMLRHELEAGPRPGSSKVRAALADAEAGAWSIPEADLLALTERSAVLPPIRLNPTLVTADGRRLPTPDGWYDDVALAAQVHSWQHHTSMPDWNATVMSDSAFAEHGIPVVPLTPDAIRRIPDQLLRGIETAYDRRSDVPDPR